MSDWGATQQVAARVVLAEGVVLAGHLHLLARTMSPSDAESPLEMLNREEPFFALTLNGGGVALVSKAQVAVVSCQELASHDDPDRVSVAKLVALAVELTDGVEYRGHCSFELPPSRSRTLDYLNGPGRFFTVETDGMMQHINKSQVRQIRPLD
jgi:hypothetical protein